MESRSGMYSAAPSGGLALEMSLRRSTPPRNPTSGDYSRHVNQSSYPFGGKSRSPNFVVSDEEEGGGDEHGNSTDDGKRKRMAWHRVKWTDNMVRLLIMAVFYIGDEVVGSNEGGGGNNEKKKQGKWRSVSGVMMEKGFNVSPQQCEDKFNDLNKRYKRVNDILGKGTACKVVEDQSLLDGMDHLSAKAKEEVRKMINSKHLFFREMCAYHNSCNHGGSGSGSGGGGGGGGGEARMGIPPIVNQEECDEDDDEDENEEDDDDEDGEISGMSRKKARMDDETLVRQLEDEMVNVLRDGRKGLLEKRRWLQAKLMQLEEDGLVLQSRGLELEKQRLKWLKFSAKKEMEMEKERLTNERMKLEHERMVILIRKQELDLIKQQ